MLKRVKIITILIIILCLFALVQIASGGLFFKFLNNERQNLADLQSIHQQQAELNSTWIALLKTRSIISITAIQFLIEKEHGEVHDVNALLTSASASLQQAEQHWQIYQELTRDTKYNSTNIQHQYDAFHNALKELIYFQKTGDTDSANKQTTQYYQDNFNTAYANYLAKITGDFKAAKEDADRSYNIALWVESGILLIILPLIIFTWKTLRITLLTPLNKAIDSIQQIASGNLSTRIEVCGSWEIRQLNTILLHMQSELAQMVANVRNSAEVVMNGAGHISSGSQELASRAEQQAASLEETAASMSELTTTVKQNADNAAQARQVVINASETARRGSKAVDSMVHTIGEITDSSQKINDITKVIDNIAFQTNILSINAAVEAARAGTQGRGFAVVANEVRRLALSSAKAAKEIKMLIDDSANKVKTGSALAESAGETMNEIVNAVNKVTQLMIEIAAASNEQSRGIEQVGIAVTTMDRVTQQNNALAQESTAAATELEEQVTLLTHAVEKFCLH